jgi:hypothetical protein
VASGVVEASTALRDDYFLNQQNVAKLADMRLFNKATSGSEFNTGHHYNHQDEYAENQPLDLVLYEKRKDSANSFASPSSFTESFRFKPELHYNPAALPVFNPLNYPATAAQFSNDSYAPPFVPFKYKQRSEVHVSPGSGSGQPVQDDRDYRYSSV